MSTFVDIILQSLGTFARGSCISRKGGTEGGGWGHLQGDMHLVLVGLAVKAQWLGPGDPILALAAGHT